MKNSYVESHKNQFRVVTKEEQLYEFEKFVESLSLEIDSNIENFRSKEFSSYIMLFLYNNEISAYTVCKDIMSKKGDDYSGENRLSNFIEVANLLNIQPLNVVETLIGVKLARIENLKSKQANFESTLDSYVDLFIYLFLYHLINKNDRV